MTELKYLWHDLRKNPSDTPKPEHVVEIAIEVRTSGRTYQKRVFGYYEDGTVHTEDSDYFWPEIESFGTYCDDTDDYIIPAGWFEEVQYVLEYDGNMIDDFVVAWREIEPHGGGSTNCTNSKCKYYEPYYANDWRFMFPNAQGESGKCKLNYCKRRM